MRSQPELVEQADEATGDAAVEVAERLAAGQAVPLLVEGLGPGLGEDALDRLRRRALPRR